MDIVYMKSFVMSIDVAMNIGQIKERAVTFMAGAPKNLIKEGLIPRGIAALHHRFFCRAVRGDGTRGLDQSGISAVSSLRSFLSCPNMR